MPAINSGHFSGVDAKTSGVARDNEVLAVQGTGDAKLSVPVLPKQPSGTKAT